MLAQELGVFCIILNFSKVFLTLFALHWLYKTFRRWKTLPPGPIGLPLVGYLPFMDTSKPFMEEFQKLGEKYGEIYMVKVGSYDVVVLQRLDVITEAFSMQVLNGRPDIWSMKLLNECGMSSIFPVEGRHWSDNRKTTAKALGCWRSPQGQKSLSQVFPELTKSMSKELDSIGEEGVNVWWFSGKIIFAYFDVVIYGGQYSMDDPFIDNIGKTLFIDNLDMNLGIWTEFMPLVQRWRKKQCDNEVAAVGNVYKALKREPKSGGFVGFAHEVEKIIRTANPSEIQKDARGLISDFFEAGMFDVMNSTNWLMAFLATEKKLTEKLRKELEEIRAKTGGETNSDFFSQASTLPLLKAFILECQRVGTPSNGLPHKVLETCQFRGYELPRGTVVIANQYASNHDPKIFESPSIFNPGRFIHPNGSFDTALASKVLVFSTGNRKCLGSFIANAFALAVVAYVCLSYDLEIDSEKDVIKDATSSSFSREPGEYALRFKRKY